MVDSGKRYIAAKGESFDLIALNVYGHERYAAELLNANPKYCERLTLEGGEVLILPSIDVRDENEPEYTPTKAPWKE